MSQQPWQAMNGTDLDARWAAAVARVAREMVYPETPVVWMAGLKATTDDRRPTTARGIMAVVSKAKAAARRAAGPLRETKDEWPAPGRRSSVAGGRWAYAALILLAAAAALLAVPAVRAGVVEFLQIGAVRILLGPRPTETPRPAPTASSTRAATAVPPTPLVLTSVLDLAGETTLAEARAGVDFAIPLPTYPPDLGEPDRVFVQDLDGAAVVLVWLQPDDPARPRLVLNALTSPIMADKVYYELLKQRPLQVEVTTVNGGDAVWTTGPYVLETRGGDWQEYRLIEGHVLIWTDGALTYRLETDATLEEAVRMAESIE
jgi:hypothetical protein